MTTTEERPTYGGLRPPASPGIGPFRLYTSVAMMGGLATAMLLMTVNLWLTVALVALVAVMSLPILIRRNQRPLAATWVNRYRHKRAARKGLTVYRSGLIGPGSTGRRRLPGLLAPVEVWNCSADGLGRPFALIEIPAARQWAVTFRVDPDGGALVDRETKDLRVAEWGELLATVGAMGGIRQVGAVIETQPDSGALLAAHVARICAPGAPPFAVRAMKARAAELPRDVASTVGWVAVTYTEKDLGIDRKAKNTERAGHAADEIGRRMPELSSMLILAGASRARPVDVWGLTRRVSEAYDPGSVVPNAEDEAEGRPPQIAWADCGPTAADDSLPTTYFHDSGVSRTWEALKPPPGVFTDEVLKDLVGPNLDAPRKRVTLIYHPVDAANAPDLLDRDVKTALNRAGRRKGPVHAHDDAGVRIAQQAAREEASGAGVTSMSMLVTATVLNDEHDPDATREALHTAATAVERAARHRRIKLAPIAGGQAAGFAAALGVGLCLPDLSLIPDDLRINI